MALVAATRVIAPPAQPQTPASVAFLQRRLARPVRGLRVAEANDAAFLGLTALAGAHRDAPARTAFLALLALGAARELTTSRRALVRLALTVLLAELPDVPGADPRFAPARAASAVVGVLGADPGAPRRRRRLRRRLEPEGQRTLGPLDHGSLPRGRRARSSRRALLERIAPADGSRRARWRRWSRWAISAPSIPPPTAAWCARSGVTPAGTIVELEGGECHRRTWAATVTAVTTVREGEVAEAGSSTASPPPPSSPSRWRRPSSWSPPPPPPPPSPCCGTPRRSRSTSSRPTRATSPAPSPSPPSSAPASGSTSPGPRRRRRLLLAAGTTGAFSARVRQLVDAGDHTLVLGDVTAVHRAAVDAHRGLGQKPAADRGSGPHS